MRKAIMNILDIAEKTYYNWKKQRRPIIGLLEKYFTEEDISEYLETGKISRFETRNTDLGDVSGMFLEYVEANLPDRIDRLFGKIFREDPDLASYFRIVLKQSFEKFVLGIGHQNFKTELVERIRDLKHREAMTLAETINRNLSEIECRVLARNAMELIQNDRENIGEVCHGE